MLDDVKDRLEVEDVVELVDAVVVVVVFEVVEVLLVAVVVVVVLWQKPQVASHFPANEAPGLNTASHCSRMDSQNSFGYKSSSM